MDAWYRSKCIPGHTPRGYEHDDDGICPIYGPRNYNLLLLSKGLHRRCDFDGS